MSPEQHLIETLIEKLYQLGVLGDDDLADMGRTLRQVASESSDSDAVAGAAHMLNCFRLEALAGKPATVTELRRAAFQVIEGDGNGGA